MREMWLFIRVDTRVSPPVASPLLASSKYVAEADGQYSYAVMSAQGLDLQEAEALLLEKMRGEGLRWLWALDHLRSRGRPLRGGRR